MFRELTVVALGVALGAAGMSLYRAATPLAESMATVPPAARVIKPAPDRLSPPAPDASGPNTFAMPPGAPGPSNGPFAMPPGAPGPGSQPFAMPPGAPGPGGGPYFNIVPQLPPMQPSPGGPPFGTPGQSPFGMPMMPGLPPGGPGLPGGQPGAPGLPGAGPGLPGQPPMGGPGALPNQPPLASPGAPNVPGVQAPGAMPPGTFVAGKPSQADVAYGSEPLQKLDLYAPSGGSGAPSTGAAAPSGAAAPMVLFVHGGGWSIGDKSDFGWLGAQLASQGYLVAVANYRLSPAVQHPAHVQDVAAAVGWLVRNGQSYGGDPSRLYLFGHSAGAHLVSLVTLDSSYLAAQQLSASAIHSVVGVAGAGYDLDTYYATTPMASLLFPAFGSDPTTWAKAAPVRYVKPHAPPFYLAHGLNDTSAPVSATQTFAAALTRDGVPTQLNLLPNEDHLSVLVAALPVIRAFMK